MPQPPVQQANHCNGGDHHYDASSCRNIRRWTLVFYSLARTRALIWSKLHTADQVLHAIGKEPDIAASLPLLQYACIHIQHAEHVHMVHVHMRSSLPIAAHTHHSAKSRPDLHKHCEQASFEIQEQLLQHHVHMMWLAKRWWDMPEGRLQQLIMCCVCQQ